ncbi:MAG: hypothetical protein JOZ51_13790, partial [Chloroflexi bacterium]|nr:hypothetical protein [Chloroflexota bacterium]
RQKLVEAQSQLDLLTGERTNLLSRNERFKERLDELRDELDAAHSQRAALAQEQQQAVQVIRQLEQQLAQIRHTYTYMETLLGHALEVLHRMLIDQQLLPKTSMPQQLATALDEYASTKTYRSF